MTPPLVFDPQRSGRWLHIARVSAVMVGFLACTEVLFGVLGRFRYGAVGPFLMGALAVVYFAASTRLGAGSPLAAAVLCLAAVARYVIGEQYRAASVGIPVLVAELIVFAMALRAALAFARERRAGRWYGDALPPVPPKPAVKP